MLCRQRCFATLHMMQSAHRSSCCVGTQRVGCLAGIACSSGALGGVKISAGHKQIKSSAELPLCGKTLKLCYTTPRYTSYIKHLYAICCSAAFGCSCRWHAVEMLGIHAAGFSGCWVAE